MLEIGAMVKWMDWAKRYGRMVLSDTTANGLEDSLYEIGGGDSREKMPMMPSIKSSDFVKLKRT